MAVAAMHRVGENPFAPISSAGTYVPRPATEAALELLESALAESVPLVLLHGSPGIGKTQLLKVLGHRIEAPSRAVYLPYASFGPEDLAVWLAAQAAPGADASGGLEAAVGAVAGSGKLVLLVDDAEVLPLETCRALAEVARKAPLQLVLSGADEERLEAVAASFQLAEKRTALLDPLSPKEVRALLEARLVDADPERRTRFDDATVDRLQRDSEGVPAVLEQLASDVFEPAPGPHGGVRTRAAPSSLSRFIVRKPEPEPEREPVEDVPAASPIRRVVPVPELVPKRPAIRPRRRAAWAPGFAAGLLVGAVLMWLGVPRNAPIEGAAIGLPQPPPVEAAPPVVLPRPDMLAIQINATPWASIEVDGRSIGETPLADVPLEPGEHVFRASFPDGRVVERRIEVRADHRHVVFE